MISMGTTPKIEKYKLQNPKTTKPQNQARMHERGKNADSKLLDHTEKIGASKLTVTPMACKFLLLLFSVTLFLIPYSSQNPNPKTSNSISTPSPAYTELTNYGFPVGLLPATTVSGYTVNDTSSEFSVHLGGSCKITLPPDNYVAIYSKRITGKIVKGKIAELDGIRVRALFKWWSITGIRSSGDDIVFEVGMVTAKYPAKIFDQSPACEGQHSAS